MLYHMIFFNAFKINEAVNKGKLSSYYCLILSHSQLMSPDIYRQQHLSHINKILDVISHDRKPKKITITKAKVIQKHNTFHAMHVFLSPASKRPRLEDCKMSLCIHVCLCESVCNIKKHNISFIYKNTFTDLQRMFMVMKTCLKKFWPHFENKQAF